MTSPIVRDDPFFGGQVRRWHTWPMLKEETVAEHSWHVTRILLAIEPSAERHLMIHALMHDVGEVGTGDVPYPVKADNPYLQQICDRLERETWRGMVIPWMVPPEKPLEEEDRRLLKTCDALQTWERGLCELMMGNQYARLVVQRGEELACATIDKMSSEDRRDRAGHYMAKRRLTWQT